VPLAKGGLRRMAGAITANLFRVSPRCRRFRVLELQPKETAKV